jgi:FeS assembly SUF system protein
MTKELLEKEVIVRLKSCYDPEISIDIFELGLIYETRVDDELNVYIKMTLTSPMCPVAEELPSEIKTKVKGIEGVKDVYIDLVWNPPWDKDMMSEAAKLELGFL